MAIIFDSTISGLTSNSYASIADYNQYRENHGLAVRTDEQAQVDLIKATLFIDTQYKSLWNTQSKTVEGQALHWGQSGAYYYDNTAIDDDIIPDAVKKAVYEYAIRSVDSTSLDPQSKTNIKSQELDGVGNIEYFSKTNQNALSDEYKFIDQILLGLISNSSGGVRLLRMQRY